MEDPMLNWVQESTPNACCKAWVRNNLLWSKLSLTDEHLRNQSHLIHISMLQTLEVVAEIRKMDIFNIKVSSVACIIKLQLSLLRR